MSDLYIPTPNELRARVGSLARFARLIDASPNYLRNILHRHGGCMMEPGALWGVESRRVLAHITQAMETEA